MLMEMEHVSVDISQIKAFALGLRAHLGGASVSVSMNSPTTRLDGPDVGGSCPDRDERAIAKPSNGTQYHTPLAKKGQRQEGSSASQVEVLHITSASTKPRMSDGTQRSDGTEVLSQWVYENETSKSMLATGKEPQTEISPQKTYHSGDPGYVALDMVELDDLEDESQANVSTDLYPEHKRFQPETPATHGKKRDYNGNVVIGSASMLPPNPPNNPFGRRQSPSIGMTMSQAFKNTQAPSSPFTTGLLSEPTSDRPSPDMHGIRPSTAWPCSSPAKLERSSVLKRARTEPHSKWNGPDNNHTRSSPMVGSVSKRRLSDSDDDFTRDSTPIRRHKQQMRAREGRLQLNNMRAPGSRSGFGASTPSRSRRRGNSSPLVKPEACVTSSGRDDDDESDEETEHEEEPGTPEVQEFDELGEDNKENIEKPRAGVRLSSRLETVRRGPVASPLLRRTSQAHLEDESSDELSQHSPLPTTTKSSRKAGSTPNGTQEVAIADSQVSPSSSRLNIFRSSNGIKSRVPGSSDGSKNVIRESQTAKRSSQARREPVTPQTDSTKAPGMFAHSSSQVSDHGAKEATRSGKLPLSSPDKANISYVASKGKNAISSSPPLVKLSDFNVEIDAFEKIVDGTSPASLHYETDVAASLTNGNVDRLLSKPVKSTHVHQTPVDNSTTLASTIPETAESLVRFQSPFEQRLSSPTIKTGILPTSGSKNARPSFASGPLLNDDSETHQPMHLAPTSSNLVPGSTQNPPHTKSPRQPTKMREITDAQVSQEDESIEILFPDGLLTEEDKQFSETIEKLSSPIRPGRRRRTANRLNHDTHTSHAHPAESSPVPLTTMSPMTEQPGNKKPREENTPDNCSQDSMGNPDELAEKENNPRTMQKARSSNSATDRSSQVTRVRQIGVNKEALLSAKPRLSSKVKKDIFTPDEDTSKISSSPAPTHPREPSATLPKNVVKQASKENVQEPCGETKLPVTVNTAAIVRPHRILALFKGSPLGYFPATCVSVSPDEPRYKVRFDDHTMSQINSWHVKRLELRVGDELKVDQKGLKKNTYIVKELTDLDETATLTDIYGRKDVIVTQKTKAGIEKDAQQHKFVLANIYWTLQMWTSLKDRDPIPQPFFDGVEEVGAQEVASVRLSTPATPTSISRLRSLKVEPKPASVGVTSALPVAPLRPASGVFLGLIFAITSISDRRTRDVTENLIRANGGRILNNSFEELFSIPVPTTFSTPPQSSRSSVVGSSRPSTPLQRHPISTVKCTGGLGLRSSTAPASPTLLLADNYSRNTKFFQALALGIPCLHTRWVRDCISQHKLLGWHPYLLAAGESAFLGGSVKSRTLPYYGEQEGRAEWGLQKMIDDRPKWLAGRRVMLVSAGQAGQIEAYIFIALALGAVEVVVTRGREEARSVLQGDTEKWHWVCVNEDERPDSEANAASGRKGRASKSRKSGKQNPDELVDTEVDLVEGLSGIKMVSTESVVQSLILDRLLEPGELSDV